MNSIEYTEVKSDNVKNKYLNIIDMFEIFIL